ncbi:hypothetical protein IQ268_28340 [Oculatella sp. LEGE 06141]|uniref:hypothetical protein n=1 Tax=Oculatella sp. LEGE 06141 TaxID=1828648 RepID=UPI001881E492|nr:hypothetical protein [Oculatella sp. LEGE 06141]MBE9182463.1 hypothetical protein [Oculatella sp. LEGE 06141]
MTKTYVERTLETLVEFADIQRSSLNRLTENIETMNSNLSANIETANQKLSTNIERTNQNINLLSERLDTLTSRVDTIAVQISSFTGGMNELKGLSRQIVQAIEGDRQVALQQTENVSQLIELAKQQQAMVERIMSKSSTA